MQSSFPAKALEQHDRQAVACKKQLPREIREIVNKVIQPKPEIKHPVFQEMQQYLRAV